MKKPLNKFAICLWALAVMYVIAEVWAYLYFYHMGSELLKLGSPPQFPAFLNTPPSLVLSAAVLASLGVLVEIGDKIRWLLEQRGT